MKKTFIFLRLTSIIFGFLLTASGCRHNPAVWSTLERADTLMWSHPDSSLTILRDIDTLKLSGEEEKARYALLMSMASDKNYIDTTNFNILQPAIDYYLKRGGPDEKLRTHYYQGCIYQNLKDYDNAMMAFLNAENQNGITDSLILAKSTIHT